ncbi:MAG: transposase [Geminicoccaceae bacterium]
MSTKMTDADWQVALEAFRGCLPARGAKARNDLLFLEALHYFSVHNITWRALPARFGHWNTVWKRFSRLSNAGVFDAYFALLADLSGTAHLVQMFDSTIVVAHVSAAGAKGGGKPGAGPLTWRIFDEDTPEDRPRWLPDRLRSDGR